MRTILAGVLGVFLMCCGGCVFWDIRDEVRKTDARLDSVQGQLVSTNAGLDATNAKLDGVNTQLAKVDTSLERLDATNRSLNNVEERLVLLRSLDASLGRMDVHLASLRMTIGRIDGMIPFLDLGTESDPEPAAAAVVAVAEPVAEPKAEGSAEVKADAKGTESAPARRDAILGTWLSQYPDRSVVLVLQEDGRYQRQSGSGPRIESGAWKRAGKELTLTSEPVEFTKADGTKETRPMTTAYEIVAQTARSLTVRGEGKGILVFSKP